VIRTIITVCFLTTVLSSSAAAQYRRPPMRATGQPMTHRFEFSPYGGYMWTFSRRVNTVDGIGDLDIENSPYWGVELDVNLEPGGQLALLYSRQDSDLTFKRGSGGVKSDITGMSVEYFQVGGIGGVKQGNTMPFGMVTLGATRFAFDRYNDDVWKFSIMLAFGAKLYATDLIGLRVQATLPFSFTSGGIGIGCGGGGCYTTVGGSGIAQIGVTAGLTAMF
jgi:hypothetical protein